MDQPEVDWSQILKEAGVAADDDVECKDIAKRVASQHAAAVAAKKQRHAV